MPLKQNTEHSTVVLVAIQESSLVWGKGLWLVLWLIIKAVLDGNLQMKWNMSYYNKQTKLYDIFSIFCVM